MSEAGVVEAVVEANEYLQDENARLRNINRILRTVISALRGVNEKLRAGVAIAKQNDEIFKSFCQGDFDEPVSVPAEVGLTEVVNAVETQV